MRVTKIDKPVAVFRKALGYDPTIPDGDVEEPEFEGAFVLIPRDNSGIEFVPAPTVTDGDLDTYAETDAHDEAMRITLDFASRFVRVEVLGAWETSTERTYTLEAANLADYSDAVELDSQTFTAPADWEPYEVVFEYESLPTAYQYYRLIGPDEVRRWHNLRLIPASVDGCECIELCRDSEPPALIASNTGFSANPIDLGAVPEPGDLWVLLASADEDDIPGFTALVGPEASGGTITATMYAREAEASDDGTVTLLIAPHWITASFRGVGATADATATTEALGGSYSPPITLEVPITVPSGDHLVVAFMNNDITDNATTDPKAGWTEIEFHAYASGKAFYGIYKFVSGGSVEEPGWDVAVGSGSYVLYAASFPITSDEAIVGGPNATAGDGTKAAPCTHDHHYTAEQVEVTPFGSIAADNVQDALEEIFAESGAGTPATTVESETTFGITPAVGTDTEYARQDHTHGSPANPLSGAALVALGLVGPLLIADDHSTPLVFEDILQTEEGDDFLYADIGA